MTALTEHIRAKTAQRENDPEYRANRAAIARQRHAGAGARSTLAEAVDGELNATAREDAAEAGDRGARRAAPAARVRRLQRRAGSSRRASAGRKAPPRRAAPLMPRAKARRECVAHRLDCALAAGSFHRSPRCSRVQKGGRQPGIGVEFRAIFAGVSPAELAARDAEHAAWLAAMTLAQRCAYRDGIPTSEAQLAAIRVESQRVKAELRQVDV